MAVAQSEEEKGQAAARSTAAARLAAKRAAKAAAKAAKRGTAPVVPSRITSRVLAAREAFERNQRAIGLGVVAAALAVGGWYLLSSQLGKHAREGAELLATGVATANAPIVAAGEEVAGHNLEESYPTDQAREEKSREEFASVLKRYGDTPAGAWARLADAKAASDLGHPEQAEKLYQQVLALKDEGSFVRVNALEGLGFALEAQQKFAAAADRFQQIDAIDNGAYKTIGDYHRARMLIALGQKEKAGELLQALVKAERARPPGEGMHFDDVVSDSETLLSELAVELNSPKLRIDLPANNGGLSVHPGPSAGTDTGTGLTQEIVDALRKQLASGKGGKGLTKDMVEQLDKQVKSGKTSAKTVRIPASKPAESKQE